MTTDQELRAALRAAVDAELDVAGFRARLDTAVAEDTAFPRAVDRAKPAAQAEDEGEVFDLHRRPSADVANTRRRRWAALAMAACVAGIAAVAGVAVTHHSVRTPSTHRVPAPAPRLAPLRVLGTPLFPGSKVLAITHGTGARTVSFPVGHATPRSREHYLALITCSSGRVIVRSGDSEGQGRCFAGAFGAGLPRSAHDIRVQVDPGTTWRLALVIEPDARTNAGVEAPPQSGQAPRHRGSGAVTFPALRGAVPAVGPYQLIVTCTGSGFRLSGLHGSVRGDYSDTCFPGFGYVWNLKQIPLPATLRVHADPDTTWTARLLP